ncbi:hypothetical protein sos41_02570 [Alphaproteobacteria bacterium SO-S41]|nr:hypothetical protein sos41_02570 [Alphaproteobacteria bacterium SO-S41]
MSDIADLLEQLVEEVRGLRSDIAAAIPVFDLENLHHRVATMATDVNFMRADLTTMSVCVAALGTDITGPLGHNLGDIHDRFNALELHLQAIEINTDP